MSRTFGWVLLAVLASFLPWTLHAGDNRTIPLDMNLIIDASLSLKGSKNDAIAWIDEQVVKHILMDGDRITIWAAGDKAEIIFSDTLSGGPAGKKEIKDKLYDLDMEGAAADFGGALREAASRISQSSDNRMPYTMLISGSARGLEPVLTGNTPDLLRWFRSQKHGSWQVFIVAPNIGRKVQQAAAAYMASR